MGGDPTSDAGQPPTTVETAAVDPEAIPCPDIYEEIHRLAQLRDEGLITNEEFEAKKRELLDRI